MLAIQRHYDRVAAELVATDEVGRPCCPRATTRSCWSPRCTSRRCGRSPTPGRPGRTCWRRSRSTSTTPTPSGSCGVGQAQDPGAAQGRRVALPGDHQAGAGLRQADPLGEPARRRHRVHPGVRGRALVGAGAAQPERAAAQDPAAVPARGDGDERARGSWSPRSGWPSAPRRRPARPGGATRRRRGTTRPAAPSPSTPTGPCGRRRRQAGRQDAGRHETDSRNPGWTMTTTVPDGASRLDRPDARARGRPGRARRALRRARCRRRAVPTGVSCSSGTRCRASGCAPWSPRTAAARSAGPTRSTVLDRRRRTGSTAPCAWARPGGLRGLRLAARRPRRAARAQDRRAARAADPAGRGRPATSRSRSCPAARWAGGTGSGWPSTRRGRAGLRAHRSHDVLPIADCPLVPPGHAAAGAGAAAPAGRRGRGGGRRRRDRHLHVVGARRPARRWRTGPPGASGRCRQACSGRSTRRWRTRWPTVVGEWAQRPGGRPRLGPLRRRRAVRGGAGRAGRARRAGAGRGVGAAGAVADGRARAGRPAAGAVDAWAGSSRRWRR